MIYTCYEMVGDCRANLPEGWAYFITEYVPLIRKLMAHYAAGGSDPDLLNRVLLALRKPESKLFQSLDPAPERPFAAELRQNVLAEIPAATPEGDLDLDTLAAALAPFTLVEKQAAWFESMRYSPAETSPMVKMEAKTVERIRGRAADAIRGRLDHWSSTLLVSNGRALGLAAAAGRSQDCLPVKAFLDVIDGRTTWRGREDLDRHVSQCWHCIDHFCRMMEVVEMLRGLQPFSEAEARPFRELFGIVVKKPGLWRRASGLRSNSR